MIHGLTKSISSSQPPATHPTILRLARTRKVIALGKTTHIFTGFWRLHPPPEIANTWRNHGRFGASNHAGAKNVARCHKNSQRRATVRKKKRYIVDVAKALKWRQEKAEVSVSKHAVWVAKSCWTFVSSQESFKSRVDRTGCACAAQLKYLWLIGGTCEPENYTATITAIW